jgi:NADPH-dependent glutamate synthase beta subunit-like oxidoreductase
MTRPEERGEEAAEEAGNAVVDWARAIVLGIRDTARDMVDAGRAGAREAQEEYWRRFDQKTKRRRTRG